MAISAFLNCRDNSKRCRYSLKCLIPMLCNTMQWVWHLVRMTYTGAFEIDVPYINQNLFAIPIYKLVNWCIIFKYKNMKFKNFINKIVIKLWPSWYFATKVVIRRCCSHELINKINFIICSIILNNNISKKLYTPLRWKKEEEEEIIGNLIN